ncbi:hypothetical protein [Alphabaculovirus altersperidaniae]|uniref:Uncharacterized protein n=1 Tax=Spodoptera eridania nucleopolyhedrovirus TaxID=2315721 RepID=A0ABX6TQI4_9ABAC|nr:hypothetical protein QKS47_gp059 [Spodoptera eridania nucleopolyhedrovirus]QNV47873.1 hypothetical protein [Spodoptera eridania nucleopolyhedrovirus]
MKAKIEIYVCNVYRSLLSSMIINESKDRLNVSRPNIAPYFTIMTSLFRRYHRLTSFNRVMLLSGRVARVTIRSPSFRRNTIAYHRKVGI